MESMETPKISDQGINSLDTPHLKTGLVLNTLQSWLGKSLKITISDSRTLIGTFVCTDRDANVILENCLEYTQNDLTENLEPRMLGLALVPGKHIVTVAMQ